jgi:hypothetical protein
MRAFFLRKFKLKHMKKIKTALYSALLILFLTGLSFSDSFTKSEPEADFYKHRVGARCCDGTNSKATGRGACSHHGGVKYWIYNDGSKEYTGKCP